MVYPFDLTKRPDGYEPLASEPHFDPSKHLQLEKPSELFALSDFGYDAAEIAQSPTNFGATSVFRVLSDEGAEVLYDVCKQLESFTTSNPRISRNTRGGVYRSKFLRELCLSIDVADWMSELAGLDLMPHTIPHQLGHLNYNPKEVGEDVDKWHVDTLRYDYVMFVTDPTKVQGGAFQYFKGTKHEMGALSKAGLTAPLNRVIAPKMPGPGYAVLMQGNMVVHQAKGLTAPGERITMVNGYVPKDARIPDYTRYDQLVFADPAHVVTSEFMRHMAFEGVRRLNQSVEDLSFTTNREAYANELEALAARLKDAASDIRNSDNAEMEHF
ncbi:MAG: hypothetical protein AAF198_05550 [Pseudomonadota bacterium]